MAYRLKAGQPAIVMRSGEYRGRKFIQGVEYSGIPAEEKDRFEEINPAKPAKEKKGGDV